MDFRTRTVTPAASGMRDGFHAEIHVGLTGPHDLPPICLMARQERFSYQDYMSAADARVLAAALNDAADTADALATTKAAE